MYDNSGCMRHCEKSLVCLLDLVTVSQKLRPPQNKNNFEKKKKSLKKSVRLTSNTIQQVASYFICQLFFLKLIDPFIVKSVLHQ